MNSPPPELPKHFQELIADPLYSPSYRRLVDLRLAFISLIIRHEKVHPPRAFVAGSAVVYGMLRMLEILSEDWGLTNRAFRSLDEAERWLRVRQISGK